MALTRESEDPLTSEEDTLRRAALLQLAHTPTEEAAKTLTRAMIHFLRAGQLEIARSFIEILHQPPMGRMAERPVLELLDHEEEIVREQAAFILYMLRIRESSRTRVVRAIEADTSPWVRAYLAKALAVLGGPEVGAFLAEAIDNEATLEAISRFGEALALTGGAQAPVLLEQVEQLRQREPPADAEDPQAWRATAEAVALFLEALAAWIDDTKVVGLGTPIPGASPEHIHYLAGERGAVDVAGGAAYLGYVARVQTSGHVLLTLAQDSREALALLPVIPAS